MNRARWFWPALGRRAPEPRCRDRGEALELDQVGSSDIGLDELAVVAPHAKHDDVLLDRGRDTVGMRREPDLPGATDITDGSHRQGSDGSRDAHTVLDDREVLTTVE